MPCDAVRRAPSPFDCGKTFAIQAMDFDAGRREIRVLQCILAHFPASGVIDVAELS